MEQKRVLITICGRAGSKGFKNKNLKIFDGHPLSYYSLSAAELFIRSRPDLAVDVCLNTDSGLLIDVITKKYPEVTVLPRPEELCGDIVPKMPVYQYSLRQMEQKKGYEYDTLIDLDITSPLRQTGDIEGAYEVKASRPDLDLIFSVTPSRRTPYMNMAKLAGDHVEKVIDHHNTARQQTPPVFDINASIYVFERRLPHREHHGLCLGRQMRHVPDVRHRHHRHRFRRGLPVDGGHRPLFVCHLPRVRGHSK